MPAEKSIYAREPSGKMFVEVAAIMNPICALVDRLPLAYFEEDDTTYIEIDEAIKWCREEMKHHSAEKYKQMIAILEDAKARSHSPQT